MPNKLKKYKKLDVINSQRASCQVDIGESNVNSWNHLKLKLNFKKDSDFVECLLSIAEKYICSKLIISYNGKRVDDDDSNSSDGVGAAGKVGTSDDEIDNSHDVENSIEDTSKVRSATPEKASTDDGPVDVVNEESEANIGLVESAEEVVKIVENPAKNGKDCYTKKIGKRKPKSRDASKKKKSLSDEATLQSANSTERDSCQKEIDKIDEQLEKSIVADFCCFCDAAHSKENCPLHQSFDNFKIACDSITNIAHSGVDRAKSTLPDILEMKDKNGKDSTGIFAKFRIEKHTVFGPLVGKQIKEMEIADDSSMKHIWEVCEGSYLSTSDPNSSNWIRWLCPAASRHDRNVVPVERGGQLFFVSTTSINAGSELVYWAETTGAWANKKMEKTNCGGCNLQFEHAMYYRTHCAVFHEASLSLTVRKYHCKICGKAVLGKQNIMKHALLNHDGKGAYQCQFCSKFFLRLNYLEMHRNYGCSANPHRARPLCDYCGRKFCQPQKLKVHIKRMHSDLADVLHEFQCRDCLKVLGSRAALQRHTKEVHKRPSGVSCSKCSKTFQNKSNLKIHMLTHSGIKPFKCQEDRCAAAFTTKQCLQFHYKKVHGLTEDRFPSIVRSVDYTFESYAGVEDGPREMDDPTSNDQGWPDESGGEGKGTEEDSLQRDDDMDESLDVNDNESTSGPVCEETSVIEYHSSHNMRRNFTDALELTQPNKDHQVPGVIVGGQSSNASLLVEAALESAEKELGGRPEIQSPPPLPKSIQSPPGGFRFEVSHHAFPLSARLPASSILSVENLTDAPTLAHDDKRPTATSPGLLPVVYDSVLRQCTPPVPSPQHVTYLSPRYDRHYMSPPPPPSDYLQEEQRFHDEDIAQNLTKYAKYEEARVMYHELIPRYPPPPLPSVDYFGPWDLLRSQPQSDILRPPVLPQTVGLPASVDLSVNGHLPPLERPPSPAFHQFHHIPHKSPIYHRYNTYY